MDNVVEKIHKKHGVTTTEVEELFQNGPKTRRGPKGNFINESLYYALGRTNSNRLLFAVFIHKRNSDALIITARQMDNKEKSIYSKL